MLNEATTNIVDCKFHVIVDLYKFNEMDGEQDMLLTHPFLFQIIQNALLHGYQQVRSRGDMQRNLQLPRSL